MNIIETMAELLAKPGHEQNFSQAALLSSDDFGHMAAVHFWRLHDRTLRKWAAGTTPLSSTSSKFGRRSLHLNGRKRDAGVPSAWTRLAKGAGVADLAEHPLLMHQCQGAKDWRAAQAPSAGDF